ncbi:BZ3500_MvSof-1268-A1-R1_Chr7-1g09173 [Microbotryum saponariae]|uniref:Protein SDA1 n=1 Tax=Microbotryum saponariae TaxID=289078 RepID=A0A2X0M1T2_9BASI|nr:BZ3501_MvSof-1269-A2-R1_Chr7-1g08878 [Microbotryum saponariae]SDA02935.1 BZ3500_MvSof-1268-A1-R1_Chr7-1g09173 [Microbotryum saponariae]
MAAVEVHKRIAPTIKNAKSSTKSRQQAAPNALRVKTARGALITTSLPSLQNLIKRSSDSYAEEFAVQWARFGSLVKIVQLGLGGAKGDEDKLREVTGFVCQVAHLYPTMTSSLPSTLSNLLLSSAPTPATSSAAGSISQVGNGVSGGGVQLGPETRKTMMQGLVLLRRREVISGVELLKTLFPLLSLTTSPNLRSFILKTILGDIRNANLKTKNLKLNRMVQGLLFGMIEKGIDAEAERLGTGVKPSRRGDVKIVGAREAMWAVKIASDLWRKNVWRDARTVSIVASACFHPDTKVQSAAMHFFLALPDGSKEGGQDSSDEEDEGPDIKTVKHRQEINKKRKSTERRAKKDIKNANAKRRQREAAAAEVTGNFSALQLLNDPQTFGEKLYQSLVKYDRSYTLDHKVLVMQLFGRVCGSHKLTVLSFYSYIVKYLTHHQLQITAILVALAESVHELTPPDELTPVVRKLAHEFVHSGVAAEVNAAGLNAITEICRRQPWCMEKDLLDDLVEYRLSKDKGIMVAARGLLALYREVNPGLLQRRDRGKVASMKATDEMQPLGFGQSREDATGIEGLDLLAQHLAEREAKGEEVDEEAEWDDWELDEDDSDSSGGWNDVSSDEEDIDISDSDDDEETMNARKRRRIEKKEAKGKKVVEVAGLVEDDKIAFDEEENDSEAEDEEDSDDESGEEEVEVEDEEEGNEQGTAIKTVKFTGVVDPEDEDEMSLTRANKELAGTTFAMTKILTPADFAKINELRTAAAEEEAKNGGGGAARRKLAALAAARKANTGESSSFLTEGVIIGVQKKAKASYEERLALIAEGREGREKFGSLKHKKLGEKEHSTTNEEKRKKKAFAMVANSRNVRKKNTSSLQQKSKKLRNHIDRIKRGGRRGNNG